MKKYKNEDETFYNNSAAWIIVLISIMTFIIAYNSFKSIQDIDRRQTVDEFANHSEIR